MKTEILDSYTVIMDICRLDKERRMRRYSHRVRKENFKAAIYRFSFGKINLFKK